MSSPNPLPLDRSRLLIGMIHLPALPGAPAHDAPMDAILERVDHDARALTAAGFDAVLVENYGDTPFHPEQVPPETVAALTRAVSVAIAAAPNHPVGVNVLRNDARSALGIAAATGASFIRVNVHTGSMYTDQGLLTGRAWQTLRLRRALNLDCAILADVMVKHATPPAGATLDDAALDLWERGRADAVIVSGAGTGRPTDPTRISRLRALLPGAPLLVGSGATRDSARSLLGAGASGLIVGSWVQAGGRAGSGVDPERASRFVEAVRSVPPTVGID
ncbi:BtpA/SgcQ family protein [Gaopeijia maritima]|uniref:BtpA/SgcQ family protein n=1 Tax=Gaopeijia maritima TaxID=3119007 RepID=UPI00324F7EE9